MAAMAATAITAGQAARRKNSATTFTMTKNGARSAENRSFMVRSCGLLGVVAAVLQDVRHGVTVEKARVGKGWELP